MSSTTLTPEALPATELSASADQRSAHRAAAIAEKLAIYGGPKAVTVKYRERWRNSRISDLTPVLRHLIRGRSTIVRGKLMFDFEDRFARFTNSRYALLMNSGTAALHSAFFAVGVRPGDEVIVPTYTWFASATPILQCGGTPIFCDVDEHTLTADPDDVQRRITPRTKAICVVHIWGNPARMDRFVEIARRHKVALIEDASHAHGATYDGKPVGGWGDIGCFSLQGTKPVSGGEAGAAVTSNPDYLDRMLALGHCLRLGDQVNGQLDVDEMSLGLKYRPHMCAIALASGGLKRIGQSNRLRRRNYGILAEELAGCDAVQPIQNHRQGQWGGLLEFILRYRPELAGGWPREAFVAAAKAEGVPISVDRYTMASCEGKLLHQAPIFNHLHEHDWGGAVGLVKFDQPPREQRFPVAERLSGELVSLPPFTKVSEKCVRQIARALRKVAQAAAHIQDLRSGT